MFLVLFVQPLGLRQACESGLAVRLLVLLPSPQDSQMLPCISDLIWGSFLFPAQQYQTSALCRYLYSIPGPKWISCNSLRADRFCNYPSPISSGSLSEAYGPGQWAELSNSSQPPIRPVCLYHKGGHCPFSCSPPALMSSS